MSCDALETLSVNPGIKVSNLAQGGFGRWISMPVSTYKSMKLGLGTWSYCHARSTQPDEEPGATEKISAAKHAARKTGRLSCHAGCNNLVSLAGQAKQASLLPWLVSQSCLARHQLHDVVAPLAGTKLSAQPNLKAEMDQPPSAEK